jgi:hypothetical protein
MSFLTPLFLAGLAALAVPVVIHLIQREKKFVVPFPSLMFLQRIPYQSIRRRRIHNWMLLIIRLAVLALVVAAFARPFIRRSERTIATNGAREVVILLDHSYSMGYADRWQRAQKAARDAVNALGVDDHATVVLFASDAEVAVRSTSDRGKLLGVIESASPGPGATRYAPALKVAGSVLADSRLPRLEAILISDFQRNGWQGGDAVQLPSSAKISTVAIESRQDLANAAVTTVTLGRAPFEGRERTTVTAAVANRSAQPMSNVAVALEIDGRAVQTEHVTLPADGSASVTFAPFTINTANTRGTVRLAPDALARDNVLHFVVSPLEPLPVVVVDRTGPGGEDSLYLLRALSIGEAPKFDITVRNPNAVTDDDLTRAAVVLLNDVPVSPALGSRLLRYVDRGGGLFVALGPRATWPGGNTENMPALSAAVDRSSGDAARLGALEYGHPVFEPFRAPRSGEFSTAQFYGYRRVITSAASRVLARFDAGAPALVEQPVGRGRILVWTSTVDLTWNDLPLKPVFLPFIHRSMQHLAAYAEPKPWLTVGQVLDPTTLAKSAGHIAVAVAPSGRRLPVVSGGPDVLQLSEQGFYELRGERGTTPVMVVASNVDVSESDLSTMDPREVVAAARATPAPGQTTPTELPISAEAQERTQKIWWYLLAAGVVLLGIDTMLSNRLSRA